jgi:DNA-binding NtrC family response regulator
VITVEPTERNFRILVADEPAEWLKYFFDRLALPGVDVRVAGTETQGLRIIQEEPVDLALIAGDLPRLGGLDFIRRVHWYRHEMPVIVLGGDPSRRWMQEALRIGVRSVLPRPINVTRLVEVSVKMLNIVPGA